MLVVTKFVGCILFAVLEMLQSRDRMYFCFDAVLSLLTETKLDLKLWIFLFEFAWLNRFTLRYCRYLVKCVRNKSSSLPGSVSYLSSVPVAPTRRDFTNLNFLGLLFCQRAYK